MYIDYSVFAKQNITVKEAFGPDFNGTIQLYLTGSQGISYAWHRITIDGDADLSELDKEAYAWRLEYLQDYIADYIDDYDDDDYAEAEAEAIAEMEIDCGYLYAGISSDKYTYVFDGFDLKFVPVEDQDDLPE